MNCSEKVLVKFPGISKKLSAAVMKSVLKMGRITEAGDPQYFRPTIFRYVNNKSWTAKSVAPLHVIPYDAPKRKVELGRVRGRISRTERSSLTQIKSTYLQSLEIKESLDINSFRPATHAQQKTKKCH
jgi:hypothetical protein